MDEDFEAELYETQMEIDSMLDKQTDFEPEDIMADLPRPFLQLSGEDGNAYGIMGRASKVMSRAGWTQKQIDKYIEEATSGDYDNLLMVTMKYCETA